MIGSQVASLFAKLGLDNSDFNSGLAHAEAAMTKTAGAMAAAGAAIGVAAAAGLGYAVKSAMDFERTMSGVGAVSGATADQMKALGNLALQLGKDTVFSAAQAGQALEELVKGGVSIEDIMGGAAKATLNLATAGGVDLKSAAEIAANAMSMFNLSGADMAHVTDQIAGAANASSLSVLDFRYSLQSVGAVANLTGQSFDSTATAIALMGAAGLKGMDGGTSLKSMLMQLQPTTAKARDMFDQLGITVNGTGNKFIDANGNFKSMRDISEILRVSLDGLTAAEKQMALEVMFGTDGIRAGAIMAKGGAAAYDLMAASMAKVTAESVAAQRLNNLAGDLEQLRGSVETFAISLGMQLTPGLRQVTQQATLFVNDAIGKLPGAIETARKSLADLSAGIQYFAGVTTDGTTASRDLDRWLNDNSKTLQVLTMAVTGLTSVYVLLNAAAWGHAAAVGADTAATWLGCAAIDAMAAAQAGLAAVMALNPIVLVTAAIVALTAGLIVAYNTSDEFRSVWDATMSGASEAASSFAASAGRAMGGLVDSLQSVIDRAGDVVLALGGIPRRVDVTIAVNTTYMGEGGRLDTSLAANPDADQLARMYSPDGLNLTTQGQKLRDLRQQREDFAAADRADIEEGQRLRASAEAADKERADRAVALANMVSQANMDSWQQEKDAAAERARAASIPPPVRPPLSTGGGGGGGGGGGKSEAEKMAEEYAKLEKEAGKVARAMDSEVGGSIIRITALQQDFGDRWIEQWGRVDRSIKQAQQDAEKALRDLAESETLNESIAARRNALGARLSDEDQVHRYAVEDSEARYDLERSLSRAKTDDERQRIQEQYDYAVEDTAHRRELAKSEAEWKKYLDGERAKLEKELHQEEVDRKRAAIIDERDKKISAINEEWAEWQRVEKEKLAAAIANEKAQSKARLEALRDEYFNKLAESAAPGLDGLKAEIEKRFGAAVGALAGAGGGGGVDTEGNWALSGGMSGTDPEHAPGGSIYEEWVAGGRYDPTNSGGDVPFMADGGIARRPTLAKIGHGPYGEAVVPLGPGGVGGGVVINLYVNLYGTYLGDDRAMVQSLARVLKPEIDRVVTGAR